jgi:hypothetical protein
MRSLQYRPQREPNDVKKEEPVVQTPEETPSETTAETSSFSESVTIS